MKLRVKFSVFAGGLGVCLLASCNFGPAPQGGATPTILPTPAVTLSVTATLKPSETASRQPQVESPTLTPTSAPPTETPSITPTLGPIEHTIKAGETLGYIIQLYGHTNLSTAVGSVIAEIVSMNGLPNADTLPGPGSVIFIPRPTVSAASEDNAAIAVQASPNVVVPATENLCQYTVQEGDTLLGIAQDYSVTLAQLAVLNTDLNVYGCNFEIPSGGPTCNPPLTVGQILHVVCPTPTPTLSPTPSGNETLTPTPTFAPPMPIYPPEGATVLPGIFSLQWVSVGVLQPQEFYLVEVTDTTTGTVFRDVTKGTSLQLPESLIPSDKMTHAMQWTIQVATPNEQNIYHTISGQPALRTFYWQSR